MIYQIWNQIKANSQINMKQLKILIIIKICHLTFQKPHQKIEF